MLENYSQFQRNPDPQLNPPDSLNQFALTYEKSTYQKCNCVITNVLYFSTFVSYIMNCGKIVQLWFLPRLF